MTGRSTRPDVEVSRMVDDQPVDAPWLVFRRKYRMRGALGLKWIHFVVLTQAVYTYAPEAAMATRLPCWPDGLSRFGVDHVAPASVLRR